MNLHEHLRDLVARQGPTVVDTAETFRAALDDFLSEEEATTGELNLLVDAVRLGAVIRLRSILDHGGTPQAAIEEAGDAFARDRGTDDLPRCRWAVAVVGYALGLVEDADVPPTGPQSIPSATQRPAATPPPPYAPTAPPSAAPPAERPPPPAAATANPPRTFPSTEDLAPGPVPVAPGPRRRSGGRMILLSLLVAAIVAAAVGVGMWLGSRDDDPNEAGDDTASEPTGGDETGSDGGPVQGGIPAESVLLPVTDEDDITRIYEVNTESGEAAPLTDGPDDRNPAISPDRSTVIYQEVTAGGSTKPMVMDLDTGKTRPLFRDDGVCDYAARPAFNPDGTRLAVICLDEFGGYATTAIVNLQGVYEASLPVAGEPNGSPTWTSGSTLVYVQVGFPEDEPSTLWETEVNGLSEPVQVTDGSAGWDTHPDWSAEADLLLYSRHPTKDLFGELMTMDHDGDPGPAAEGAEWGHPAWSPDGTQVVFTMRAEDGTEQLATASIDDDGFSDPKVWEVPGDPGVPAWGTR